MKLEQYISVMKKYPKWAGRMVIDIKDRHAFHDLEKLLEDMPSNFREALEVACFDPDVVMQVHDYNQVHLDRKIPITLHFVPLMRYSDKNHTLAAVRALEQESSWIQNALSMAVRDKNNDALAAIGDTDFHTSYAEFENKADDKKDSVLTLWNPLEEIPEEIIQAVLDSQGYFSFPYDQKYIEYIKQNAPHGIGLDRVSCFAVESYDDLYDSLANGVGSIVHDLEKV